MQEYRQTRPHHPDECDQCGPRAPGHQMCQHDGCDETAEVQHRRHATLAEYTALPETLQPIDGVCHRAVFTCGDHEPDPICGAADHGGMYYVESAGFRGSAGLQVLKTAAPQPAPCPKCSAEPGQPCVKANGKPRSADHATRNLDTATTKPTAGTACDHVHREDCGGQDACQCTADDVAPERAKRIVQKPPPPGPAPIHMPTHGEVGELLTAHGIDMDRIMTLDIRATDDGHVLHAVMAVKDNQGNHRFDDHGRLLTEEADVPFELRGPMSPAKI